MRGYLRSAAVLAMTLAFGAQAALANASEPHLPVPYGNSTMLDVARRDWNGAVPGADDYSCRPSQAHPRPVVLVGSTFLSPAVNWTSIAPYLADQGYCVFTVAYGRQMYHVGPGLNGMDPIPMSIPEIATVVNRVLAATGAKQIDVVAHSQGGVVARYFANQPENTNKIDRMVMLSSPYRASGLPVDIADVARRVIPKQLYDAALYNGTIPPVGLNVVDPWTMEVALKLQPGIRYSQITDTADEMGIAGGMQPPTGATNATTRYVDHACPTDFSQHFAQPYSPTAVAMIGNALDPDHAVPLPCTVVPLYSFGPVG